MCRIKIPLVRIVKLENSTKYVKIHTCCKYKAYILTIHTNSRIMLFLGREGEWFGLRKMDSDFIYFKENNLVSVHSDY